MTIQPLSESDSTIVTLLPIFIAKNGRALDLEKVLLTLQTASRADLGCLQYSVFHDLHDENRFVMHEEWASPELLAAHNEQAHVRDFVAQVEGLLSEPFTVTWMRPIAD
jgi:quinol monooxygenase YgiN